MTYNPTLHNMWTRLEKFYWSPEPPETYTIMHKGLRAGIGLVAHKNYGVFNAAWALGHNLKTLDGQMKAIQFWAVLTPESGAIVDGVSLESWLTLLDKESFNEWYRVNKERFPSQTREKLNRVYAGDVQSF